MFLTSLLLVACDPAPVVIEPPRVSPGSSPADLVLVLENGLRADLGAPGADAAFAAGLGRAPLLRYDAACAQSVHPFLSMGSLLTGRYPSAIPLCSIPGGPDVKAAPWCASFPEAAPTLPEVFSIYGYRTALAITTPHLREHASLVGEFPDLIEAASLSALVDASLAWWTGAAGSPRLLVVVDDLAESLRTTGPRAPPGQEATLSPALVAAYNTAAGERGVHIGKLLAGVEPHAGGREVWSFVGSAHGVSLSETSGTPSLPLQSVQHDIVLERTIHVPLRVFGPASAWTGGGEPPLVISDVHELVDLLPTFAHLGRVMPPADLAGKDLFLEDPNAGERGCYAEFGDMLAVRSRQYLLLARFWAHGGTALDPEMTRKLQERPNPGSTFLLHDVAADPMQEHNLVTERQDVAAAHYEQLLQLRTGPGSPPAGGLTREQVEALRASGALSYF